MKFFLIFVNLFLISCSSTSKNFEHTRKPSTYDRGPSTSQIILDEDKDTLLIKPNVENYNSRKLVIYLPGSSGPTSGTVNQAFSIAKSGFQVIHFCWYNCNKNYSDDLDPIRKMDLNIIAEKIRKILKVLSYQDKEVSLVGISRGAEAVTLLISNESMLDLNITSAVLIAGTPFTAGSRHSVTRESLDHNLARPQTPEYDQEDLTIPSWVLNKADIPNRTNINVYQFKKPLMIIHGELDPVWKVSNAFTLQKNYEQNGLQAQLEIISNEGHIFPREGSKSSASMIRFLEPLR